MTTTPAPDAHPDRLPESTGTGGLSPLSRQWLAIVPLTAGLCFGLTLARALWETWPVTFLFFDQTPPLRWGVGGIGALVCWVLWRSRVVAATDFAPCYLTLISLLAPDVNVLRLWTLLIGSVLLVGALTWRRMAVDMVSFPEALSFQEATDWARQPGPVQGGAEARAAPLKGWLPAVAVGIVAFAVYLLTLGQYVGRADTFEFQVTAPVLGVAHPTGYPLYILLGKLTSLLPFGSTAWRVNLSSAIPAALACAGLTLILQRLAGPPLAALAGLALAFSQTFWSQAVEAEVYALNALFVVIILGVLIDALYVTAPRFGGQGEMRVQSVWALCFAFGLGLTNHLTLALLIPAALAALGMCRPKLTVRQWAVALALFGAGLLVYLYIPLRWPALHNGATLPLGDFLAWVTGQRFGGALMLAYWSQPDRWLTIGRLIADQFGVVGLVLGVIGLARLARWFPEMGVVTMLTYGASFAYALVYIVPDIAVFLIPMHIIQVIWMAYAVHAVGDWVRKLLHGPGRRWVGASVITLAALMPLSLLWTNGAKQDPARGRALEEWGRYVLSLPLAPDSAILADSEKIAPLEYLHRIEGLRPDMEMIVLGNEALYRAVLAERLAAGQTAYLARYLPGLEGIYHLRSAGPLVEVGVEPLTEPPDGMTPLNVVFGDWARLLGYTVDTTEVKIGETGGVTLYWEREGEPTGRHQVWLRLLNLHGEVVWEGRDRFAVNNTYPANAWKAGEVIPDYHEIPFEHGILPGQYWLQVGLFEPFATVGLPITYDGRWLSPSTGCCAVKYTDPAGLGLTWTDVAAFEVTLPDAIPTLPMQVRDRLSDALLLVGYDVPETAAEGRPVSVQLHLLALRDGSGARLDLGTRRDSSAVQTVALPPLHAGDNLVVDMHPLAEAPATQYVVRVIPSAPLLIWHEVLPPNSVQPAAADALANFDGRALLLEAKAGAASMQPGGLLDVYLVWQPLQTFDKDYTVTVQLIGPDGVLHGQADSYPVQGTYPTSQWKAGERIPDGYQVRLNDDAPPGTYQVQVGLYLLATLERLPVVDATGAPVDDRYIIGTVEVGR